MAWLKGEPVEGILAPDLNDVIRDNNLALETALNKEMNFSTGGVESLQGILKQGSARMFSQASAPATRVDGSAFASTDLGLLWIDTNNNKIYTLTATTPTWTLVSTEIIAVLLASARTFAEVVTFDKAPVFGAGGGIAPAGSITGFGGASAPTGWLLCDGTTGLSTTANPEYTTLFAVIGTLYGGSGTTDFDLPDLRGRVPIGLDVGNVNLKAGDYLNSSGGEEEHTLTKVEMPLHGHPYRDASGGSDHNTTGGFGLELTGAATQSGYAGSPSNTRGRTIGGTGADGAHNNLQPYLTINYIIKY